MSMFQVGDHVRVKSREEIILSLGRSGSGLWFDRKMYECCGRDFVLKKQSVKPYWWSEFGWAWDEEWLEPYERIPENIEIDKLL